MVDIEALYEKFSRNGKATTGEVPATVIEILRRNPEMLGTQQGRAIMKVCLAEVRGTQWEQIIFPSDCDPLVKAFRQKTEALDKVMWETINMIESGAIANDAAWDTRVRIKELRQDILKTEVLARMPKLKLLAELHEQVFYILNKQ